MFLFGIVAILVVFVLTGIGIVIGLAGCLIASVLLSLGVLSSSVFIGICSGHPLAGLRAFLLQCGVVAGIPAGTVCALFARALFESYGSGWPILLSGAIGGAVGGVVIAVMMEFIFRHLYLRASLIARKPATIRGR